MGKEQQKIILAGSLWMGVQYSVVRGKTPEACRAAKEQISTPARQSINARYSYQKLMLLLACNFSPRDLVVTLTYRDGALPPTRAEADRRLSLFLRYLRAQRKAAGQEFKYVRVTEGLHTDGRLHHHVILNAVGQDYAAVRRLWRWGDNPECSPFGYDGAERWARYLTKEPRQSGHKRFGERTWRASVGLRKPEVYYDHVPDSCSLQPPAGAFVLERQERQNAYGRFTTIVAHL